MRTGMLDLRLAPARPGQTIIIATDFRRIGRRAQRHEIELVAIFEMRLETLRALARIARRPATAVDFTQHAFRHRLAVADFDVLEHLVAETELAGQTIENFVIVLRFEDRLDDLFAPLDRAVRG